MTFVINRDMIPILMWKSHSYHLINHLKFYLFQLLSRFCYHCKPIIVLCIFVMRATLWLNAYNDLKISVFIKVYGRLKLSEFKFDQKTSNDRKIGKCVVFGNISTLPYLDRKCSRYNLPVSLISPIVSRGPWGDTREFEVHVGSDCQKLPLWAVWIDGKPQRAWKLLRWSFTLFSRSSATLYCFYLY